MGFTNWYCSIFRRVRGWHRTGQTARPPQRGSAEAFNQLVRKAGLSADELRSIVAEADARLLARRLARLKLQSGALSEPDPITAHRLKAVCAICGYKYRCALQLAAPDLDPAWQDWREYCTNADTLKTLGAFGRSYDPECWE